MDEKRLGGVCKFENRMSLRVFEKQSSGEQELLRANALAMTSGKVFYIQTLGDKIPCYLFLLPATC